MQECDHLIWLPLNLLRVYHFWGASVHLGQVGADFGTKVFIFCICCTKTIQIRFSTMVQICSTIVPISGTKISQQLRFSTGDIVFVPEASADACNSCKLLQLHNCSCLCQSLSKAPMCITTNLDFCLVPVSDF